MVLENVFQKGLLRNLNVNEISAYLKFNVACLSACINL